MPWEAALEKEERQKKKKKEYFVNKIPQIQWRVHKKVLLLIIHVPIIIEYWVLIKYKTLHEVSVVL